MTRVYIDGEFFGQDELGFWANSRPRNIYEFTHGSTFEDIIWLPGVGARRKKAVRTVSERLDANKRVVGNELLARCKKLRPESGIWQPGFGEFHASQQFDRIHELMRWYFILDKSIPDTEWGFCVQTVKREQRGDYRLSEFRDSALEKEFVARFPSLVLTDEERVFLELSSDRMLIA